MDGEPRSAAPLTWLAAAFAVAVCAAAAQVGADARWLAAIGAAIAHTGSLPHSIGYAAVASSWHDAPALGQLVFHALERAGGDRGLVLAQAAAVAVAFSALTVDLRRRGACDGAGAATLLAVVVAAPASFLVVRAGLFSLALFPALVALLRRDAAAPSRRIWLVVPLLALWSNLHGGVLVGFGVLVVYLALVRRSPIVLLAGAAALLATPALLGTGSYYAGVLRGEAAAERYGLWAPLSLHSSLDVLFVAVALPLLAAALWSRPARWETVLLVVLAAMSVEASRNGVWLLLFAAPHAARAFGERRDAGGIVSMRLAAVCCVVPLLLACQRVSGIDGAGSGVLGRAAAAAHGSPILADPLDGEQLALHGHRIWIGNPLDAFPRVEQRRYLAWLRGEPAGDALLAAPVRVVVVLRGSAAQKRLAARGAYRELTRDANAIVYAATQ